MRGYVPADTFCRRGYYGVGDCTCGKHGDTRRVVWNTDAFGYKLSGQAGVFDQERSTIPGPVGTSPTLGGNLVDGYYE